MNGSGFNEKIDIAVRPVISACSGTEKADTGHSMAACNLRDLTGVFAAPVPIVSS